MSCSLSHKHLLLLLKDREGRNKDKRKKGKCSVKGDEGSLVGPVRRKLVEGISPSKAVAGEQPRREQ